MKIYEVSIIIIDVYKLSYKLTQKPEWLPEIPILGQRKISSFVLGYNDTFGSKEQRIAKKDCEENKSIDESRLSDQLSKLR